MLKKARLLTHPTLTRRDASWPRQGRSEHITIALACSLPPSRGGLAWFPTAHVERPLLHRGVSVSTGDQPGHPVPCWRTFSASC